MNTVSGGLVIKKINNTSSFCSFEVDILESVTQQIAAAINQLKSYEEQEFLKKQLYQAQKMESIGRLAGGIAHDSNNILTGIMGFAELLSLKMKNCGESEVHAANVILKGAERASHLTQQLLGFAREGKYYPKPLNVNRIIEETIRVSEKILDKTITVKFDFDRNIHNIEADRNQLDQVFTNLFINAKDAMPLGGDIVIKTENVYLDETYTGKFPELSAGSFIKISVSDTGTGMTSKIKDSIFEPFFTTKGEGRGTGLGLATVYGIIKNHKGHINVYSEPGIGTTFNIYLPTTYKSEKIETVKTTSYQGDSTILVIDDEENVRDLAKRMLESLGYRVLLTNDG